MNVKRHPLGTLLAIFVSLAICGTGHAQEVYKTVDKNGKVIFSDKPQQEDSVEVDVELKNVQPPVDFRTPRERPSRSKKAVDYALSINTPSDGQQIGPTQRSLTISASISPRLTDGDKLQFYFDGVPIGNPSTARSTTMPLGLKQRGKRQISAAVVNKDGQVLTRSGGNIIYVIRP